jgi:hypothetical protein
MYCFDTRVLGKMMTVGLGRSDADPNTILDALTPVLNQLFAIRQTNLALDLHLDWLSFDRCCALSEARDVAFDLEDFVRRYLNKGGKFAALKEFGEELRRQLAITPHDRRMRMNGHDFTELLGWYLDKTGVLGHVGSREVERMLAVSLENEWLSGQRLFRDMLDRFRPATQQ